MNQSEIRSQIEHIHAVKARYEAALLEKENVVSVGIGFPLREGQPVGEPGIIVSVTRKVAAHELAPEDLIPRQLEGVRVWVEEIGQPRARSRNRGSQGTSAQGRQP